MAKVLIIDDDTDIVMAVQMALEFAGHEVISAKNSRIGCQMLKTQQPDVLILDVMMDSPTEGFDFARKLRGMGPGSPLADFQDIPILMLSSVYNTIPLEAESEISNLPVDLFVDKPIEPNDLIAKVDWIVQSRAL